MARGPGLYSQVVTVLKIGLPLLALAMLSSLFLLGPPDDLEPGLTFGEADLDALGQGLRITRPVLTGTTRRNDPFRFTAAVVVPNAAPPTHAAITDLTGRMDFAGGPSVEVAAPVAEVDLDTQVMLLGGRVSVESSDGYRVIADRMEIDLIAGTLHAVGDVDAMGPMGTIVSETMSIVPAADGERRVFSFGEGVRLVYEGVDEG